MKNTWGKKLQRMMEDDPVEHTVVYKLTDKD
jgi:hypothetical protein